MALPDPDIRPPTIQRDGLGFRVEPVEAPVSLTFSRIVEKTAELTAEIHVQTRIGRSPEHILRRRVNLLGTRTPADLARDLDVATDSAGWPWRKIVESAFASVVESYRQGEEVKILGGKSLAPPPPPHLIDGLVLANTSNTWFGPGGTGKSTAATAACVAHRLGKPFAGIDVSIGVPLYLDWEDEEAAFERTLWEVSRGYGLTESATVHWRRMRSTLAADLSYVAALIDRIGATFVVIDSATRAMGAAGEHGTYESTAVSFAEAIRALGAVTTLIIDHVDGQTVKDGGPARKSYGSIHKMNFVRCAWSLTLDPEASEQTVGWTNVKMNYVKTRPPFGVRYERDRVLGGLSLIALDATDVEVVARNLPQWRQLVGILDRTGPIEVKAAALEMFGRDDEKVCSQIRAIAARDGGKHITRMLDGRLRSKTWLMRPSTPPTQIDDPKRNMQIVRGDADPDELPF